MAPAPGTLQEGNRFARRLPGVCVSLLTKTGATVKQAFIPLPQDSRKKERGFIQCHIAGRTLIEVGWQCLSEKKGEKRQREMGRGGGGGI